MGLLIKLIINTLAIFAGANILPGVHVKNITTAILVAIVMAVLNVLLKPILVVLTIPITIVTLGLFLLVINAIIILLCAKLVNGFTVDGFGYAVLFSLVVSLIAYVLEAIAGR
jgi:putative membrane protein